MMRTVTKSALAGAMILGFATAGLAATGEFDDMCSWGLANEQVVNTDCSVNAEIDGKTYCFSSEEAKANFMKDPDANLAEAKEYYEEQQG